ncbi:MAG: ElyC/SanA/YdcF family protein [Leptolyngbyaceae bacterium]|nr:ElyC/SanA/YdcF family protein [Leptolyngbyaceae bacterium]
MPLKRPNLRKVFSSPSVLIQRKEVWTLTAQGWGLVLLSCVASLIFIASQTYPFLAVNAAIPAKVLVVEGWLPDYALEQAIAEFNAGQYQKLITTGIPLERGYYLSRYKTLAELGASTLIALGFDPDQLVAVPAPYVERYRTGTSAISVKKWLMASRSTVKSINLFTLGTHARRSWLTFQRVMAPEIAVGVITVRPQEYDPGHWWKSSAGVKAVLTEVISFIYTYFVE